MSKERVLSSMKLILATHWVICIGSIAIESVRLQNSTVSYFVLEKANCWRKKISVTRPWSWSRLLLCSSIYFRAARDRYCMYSALRRIPSIQLNSKIMGDTILRSLVDIYCTACALNSHSRSFPYCTAIAKASKDLKRW